ncbi:hypothetical protein MUK42_34990 [Musa troglodytarum]|uniref:Uncharacterized protein n=1 Tax=Musa troglodytarum TaxID=320322 RepID=A0A9E7JCR1_9LILI|nr:hypothetical protein MUK42_34990 [Musa troglodytarum]
MVGPNKSTKWGSRESGHGLETLWMNRTDTKRVWEKQHPPLHNYLSVLYGDMLESCQDVKSNLVRMFCAIGHRHKEDDHKNSGSY